MRFKTLTSIVDIVLGRRENLQGPSKVQEVKLGMKRKQHLDRLLASSLVGHLESVFDKVDGNEEELVCVYGNANAIATAGRAFGKGGG